MSQVNDLSLEVTKVAGTNKDKYRDFSLESYIPGIGDTLNGWADELASSTSSVNQHLANLIDSLNGNALSLDSIYLYQDDSAKELPKHKNIFVKAGLGSWFGGIYLLKLDEETGFRDYDTTYETVPNESDAYYGYKLAGGWAVSGEGPYIINKDGYYYLFLSYGGLVAEGGYQMRVFRKRMKSEYSRCS